MPVISILYLIYFAMDLYHSNKEDNNCNRSLESSLFYGKLFLEHG